MNGFANPAHGHARQVLAPQYARPEAIVRGVCVLDNAEGDLGDGQFSEIVLAQVWYNLDGDMQRDTFAAGDRSIDRDVR